VGIAEKGIAEKLIEKKVGVAENIAKNSRLSRVGIAEKCHSRKQIEKENNLKRKVGIAETIGGHSRKTNTFKNN